MTKWKSETIKTGNRNVVWLHASIGRGAKLRKSDRARALRAMLPLFQQKAEELQPAGTWDHVTVHLSPVDGCVEVYPAKRRALATPYRVRATLRDFDMQTRVSDAFDKSDSAGEAAAKKLVADYRDALKKIVANDRAWDHVPILIIQDSSDILELW